MHCCADEAVAPASDKVAALSANPPAKASAIANLVTVVLMFLLQFVFVPPRAKWLSGRSVQCTIF
jgi:hypothetical protein